MLMPGRHYNADKYRFGFNGKEHDTEWKGSAGAIYDYGFRIYDPRVAKFLSVDPLTKQYPWYTPYQFAGNKPIIAIDLDGLEELIIIYSPDATERWLKTIKINTEKGIKDLIRRARYWEYKTFPDDWHKTEYKDIPFLLAPNNSSLVAKRTVFSHGKYEKSGTIHIMGYNRNQELINLLTIVREPSEIKSVEKWWHGKWIDDRWLDGCDYDEIPLFPKIIVSWNPIISGFNLVKGMQDGKDIFGNKMENRHYIIATIDVISSMFGIPGGELMKMVDDVATPIVLIIDTANATYDQYSAKDKDSNESSDSNQDTGEGGFWENTNSEETITD